MKELPSQTMNDAIQRRPLLRPLLFLVAGICLQILCPGYAVGWVFEAVAVIGASIAWIVHACSESVLRYSTRWVWGVLFACGILSFASFVVLAEERMPLRNDGLLPQRAKEVQLRLVHKLEQLQLDDTEKSVLATITLGYRATMSREVRTSFSAAGVSHILAVSGFHVAVVCGFVAFGLGFLPPWGVGGMVRLGITVALLWTYVCITGMAASAIRAGLMLTLYLIGKQFRLRTDSYNTWTVSAFLMLVYNPFYLFDIGFQLSYLAVFSILFWKPKLDSWAEVSNPLIAKLWSGVTIALAAQAGTAPLCLYYFGTLSPVFLFTNLPLTFLATLLIPLGLVWLFLPAGLPGISYLQVAVEGLMRAMMYVVELFSPVG